MTDAPPVLDVGMNAYRRWLRALRPPFQIFMSLGEAEQEALAELGDEYTQRVVILHGYAQVDPALIDETLSSETEPESEAALALRVAYSGARRLREAWRHQKEGDG